MANKISIVTQAPTIIFIALSLSRLVLVSACPDCCDEYTEDYECQPDAPRINMIPHISIDEDEIKCTDDVVGTTIQLLEAGDKEIELTENGEAIMLIGNTGTGKSTLTYFLAGDNDKLISYEKATDWYLIKDCNGKVGGGDSTIVSATVFPDLVVEPSTNKSFYDNPGFEDTRPVCIEIANAYFMKKVASHLNRIKFGFVINYSSLKPGMSRDDFIKMIRNIISFVPMIENYGDGIGLIGTKLDGQNPDDSVYINDVVKFLIGVNSSLSQVIEDADELRKAQFIVDKLIVSNGQQIAVFRAPKECGPLSSIEDMQNNRLNIINMVYNNLDYIKSEPSHFNFSISSDAINSIRNISRVLDDKIIEHLLEFTSQLKSYLIFDCQQNESSCRESIISNLDPLFQNPDFQNGYQDEEVWQNLNFSQIIERIINPQFLPSSLNISTDLLETLEKNSRYLDFLESFLDLGIKITNWLQPLKDMKNLVVSGVLESISFLDKDIISVSKKLSGNIENQVFSQLGQLTTLTVPSGLNMIEFSESIRNILFCSYNLSSNVPNLLPSEYIDEIRVNVESFIGGIGDGTEILNSLENLHGDAQLLDFFTLSNIDVPVAVFPSEWVDPLIRLQSTLLNYMTISIVPQVFDNIFNSLAEKVSDTLSSIEAQLLAIHDVNEVHAALVAYKSETSDILTQAQKFLLEPKSKLQEFLLFASERIDGLIQTLTVGSRIAQVHTQSVKSFVGRYDLVGNTTKYKSDHRKLTLKIGDVVQVTDSHHDVDAGTFFERKSIPVSLKTSSSHSHLKPRAFKRLQGKRNAMIRFDIDDVTLILNLFDAVQSYDWIPGHMWIKPFESLDSFIGDMQYWNDYIIAISNKVDTLQADMIKVKSDIQTTSTDLTNVENQVQQLEKNPVPIGFIYVQLPRQAEPYVIWPSSTWTDVTIDYAGLFFRAEGGESSSFGNNQDYQTQRITDVQYDQAPGNEIPSYATLPVGGWSSILGVGFFDYGDGDGENYNEYLQFFTNAGEVRPVNTAVRIWRRNA